MANPATREQLKDYALRSLGSPVIEVNVAEEQLEDRLDEAIEYFNICLLYTSPSPRDS